MCLKAEWGGGDPGFMGWMTHSPSVLGKVWSVTLSELPLGPPGSSFFNTE